MRDGRRVDKGAERAVPTRGAVVGTLRFAHPTDCDVFRMTSSNLATADYFAVTIL